jgi:hypothetical protein
MKNNSVYGIALVLGALGTVITMIFHPTGADLLQGNAHAVRTGEMLAIATHTLALISYPVLFFGITGVYRKFSKNELIPTAALIAFFFGGFALMIAGASSGLIAPTITRQIFEADEASRSVLHAILDYNFAVNQAFTKIFVVASSLSVILWCICLWKEGRFARIVSAIGFAVGSISLITFFAGHLKLDVHGFGLFAFAQAFWLILVGIFLFRANDHE